MRRILLATAAVLAAVLLQVTVLNNVPFPGGSGPDLVLVVVVAMALAAGPRDGAIIGFAAGLALDIAPPASDLLGQSALVFCLAGYGCGRLRVALERSAWLPLAGVALGVAAGEVLYAFTGLIFGDPDVTWQAVRQVLPAAVFYDLLLSPFVLYAVALLGGYTRLGDRQRPGGPAQRAGPGPGGRGPGWRARSATPGRAGPRGCGPPPGTAPTAGSAAGTSAGQRAGAWVDRPRPLRLRLRGGVAGSAAAAPGGQARARPAAGHGAAAAGHPAAPRRGDRGPAVPGPVGRGVRRPGPELGRPLPHGCAAGRCPAARRRWARHAASSSGSHG